MTTDQRKSIMGRWWPAAAEACGWKDSDRELRLRVFSFAVSQGWQTKLELMNAVRSEAEPSRLLSTANDLNNTTDVNAVKAALLMLADNVEGAGEAGHPEIGTARTVRHSIQDKLRCLAIYPLESPMGRAGAQALMAELIKDMFPRKMDRVTLDDLSDTPQFYRRKGSNQLHEGPSQLRRLAMRLDGLLHSNAPGKRAGLRVRAGHSLHEMKMLSGLECHCSECARRRQSE